MATLLRLVGRIRRSIRQRGARRRLEAELDEAFRPELSHATDGSTNSSAATSGSAGTPDALSCSFCLEEKAKSEFPSRRPTARCFRRGCRAVCTSCLAAYITNAFEEMPSRNIVCYECSNMLSRKDIQEFATPDTFQKYVGS